MRFCTFAFSAALTLIGVKNGWKMHEKEKKEVFSSANYVFALKPHLLQMEYIFFGVANATLSSTPITSECDSFG